MMPYTAAMSGSVSPEMLANSGTRDYPGMVADTLLQRLDGGGTPPATVRLGIVTSTYPTPKAADVRIGGTDVAVPAIPVLSSSLPAVGSTVVVLAFGASYVVLGQLGS